jgi:hypothetical protein
MGICCGHLNEVISATLCTCVFHPGPGPTRDIAMGDRHDRKGDHLRQKLVTPYLSRP